MNPFNRYSLLLCLLIAIIGETKSQELLRLEDAIQIALENNYGILVARNEAQINANNAHPGAAGLLPTVSATAGANYSLGDSYIEFNSQEGGQGPSLPDIDVKGIGTNTLNGGVTMNYTVFDGMGNVNTYRVLKQSAKLSETQTQAIIEATISQIANTYYSVARMAESATTLGESLKISRDRVARAQNQVSFGSGNTLAVLNSEVDLNTDSSNLAVMQYNLDNAKRSLNALIGREIETEFTVSTQVSFSENMKLEELLAAAEENNASMRIAEYNRQISELNLRIAKASYMPVVGVNVGYNVNRLDNGPAGFFRIQRTNGLAVGASLNFPIFAANQRKVSVQNSQISVLNAQHRYSEARQNLERDLSNAWYTFQSTLTQLKLEQKSLESAGENFTRTEDAFKLGQATNTQFRAAQLNLQRVKDRINDLRYTAKLNEIELLRLSGQLIVGE